MKRSPGSRLIFGFAVLCLISGTAHASNLILNGGFDTGDLTDWTVFTTSNGTNGSGLPDVVSFNTTGSGASLAAHFDVGEVTFDGTQQGGGIFQDVTVVTPGVYSFSLDIASQDDADGEVNGDAGTFSILIDGTTVATDSLGGFSSSFQILRGTLSGTISLGAGSHEFEVLITRGFTAGGTATPDEYIDNASLSLNTPGTPEPATFALCGAALIGLVIGSRRRRAN